MFSDITDSAVSFGPGQDGTVVVFVDGDLTADQQSSMRIRLIASDAGQEALFLAACTALSNNEAFLDLDSPTSTQAVAQVQALTRQVDALIRLALQSYS